LVRSPFASVILPATSKLPLILVSGVSSSIFVGAFSKQKGIDILIKAFKNIKNSNISLHLVGDGKLLDEIKELSKDDNRIIFYGRRMDIEDFYHEANLVVVPSVDGEGSSGVIKEAIVANKIVIASNLKANLELIKDGINGVVFENKNIKSLQNKIEDVIYQKITINQDNLIKSAKDFDCEILVQKYINEYQKLKGDC
jgi:glycosyltransferase involved in cell wall biosynthesis